MNKKIINLIILVIIVFISIWGNYTYNSISKKGVQMLNDAETIVENLTVDSYQYIFSTSSYNNISKKASFAFLGGSVNAFDIECEKSGFININIDKTLGDCRVIIVDRYERNIICELYDEGEMRVSLHNGLYDVIVVGDLFLGNIRIILDEI